MTETLIIIDWDDTLFPTTWISKNKINIENKQSKSYPFLISLDKAIADFLTKCINCGRTIIITNALITWINICSKVLPQTAKLFKYIKIVSAREEYQSVTDDVNKWKQLAFKKELVELLNNNENINSIVSIGDADYEYYALINLYNIKKNINLKSLKLVRNPSIFVVYDEIKLATNHINRICSYKKDLDLNFVVKNK